MERPRLPLPGALAALLLVSLAGPVPVAAATPSAVSPAATFGATITTKANWNKRAISVTVKAQNVPSGQSVIGFFISESSTRPTSASAWKTLPTGFTLTNVDGPHTLYVWARTKKAISAMGSTSTNLDRTAPVVTFDVVPTTTTSATVAITLSAVDGGPNASGVTKYAVVNGTTPPAGTTGWVSTAPTTFKLSTGNGPKTVSAFAKDAAGNVSAIVSDTVTLTVNAPTLTDFDITPAAKSSLTVPVYAKAGGGSGGTYQYFISTSTTAPTAATAGWKLVVSTFTFTGGDGVKTLYGWAKDSNGTVSAMRSDTYIYDTTPPTATVAVSGSGTSGVAVTFSASSDGSGSGIDGYALILGTTVPDPNDTLVWYATAAAAQTAFNAGIPSGSNQTVTGFVRDVANNVSTVNANSSKTFSKP